MSDKCLTCQLYCAAARILCYQFCCCCVHQKRIAKNEVKVVAFGYQGAGKSHLLALLCSEPVDNIKPTNGFSLKDISLDRSIMHVKELGGSESIRQYWHHYVDNIDGVIFMIDATDLSSAVLTANKELLNNIMSNSQLLGKPLLVLLTKSPELDEKVLEDVSSKLELNSICEDSSVTINYGYDVQHTKIILQQFSDSISGVAV